MINENKKKNEQVTVEYGTEDLKKILSDYLIQKFVETLNNEQEK